MTIAILDYLSINIDDFFAMFEETGPTDASIEEKRRIRDMVVTHDPAACASEYGAFALMAHFPRRIKS